MANLSKILVVEDNPILLLDLCDQLESLGYVTVGALSAGTAARLLDATFTAIITDIELGAGPDGIALARIAASAHPHMPIVVVSGGVTPDQAQLPAHATFFQKPYRLEAVLAVLERARCSHAA
jgi:DNA-binding NtrC family response regulator